MGSFDAIIHKLLDKIPNAEGRAVPQKGDIPHHDDELEGKGDDFLGPEFEKAEAEEGLEEGQDDNPPQKRKVKRAK